VVRYRFAPDVIARMLEIAWWDWDDARIREFVPFLSSPQIGRFLELAAAKVPNATAPEATSSS
jgi:hypothetical protein